ncbi:GNAT family N-acetyltransferase [Cellvibrio sp. KY-GH-1]|uniref:GNAT family N-acetyltransferase n=1 Tax=Cellvibrio sp. KY-GH-1 TaxID=2303332 RepID=UPI0012471056|nr:GNAT family N-acetyltransferase [Cellvibrio sp. KY-GH-1]QEY15029.1 GNAT family N-acetyltransferase [Cellvibrio sp. KY-GH-1]
MNIVIREAAFSDLRNLAELFDLYRQFYEQEPDYELAFQFLSSRFKNSESTILIAESDDLGLVGFCQLYPTFCSVEATPIYSLYDLFVLPDARKLGVGRQLLLAAEVRALADGKARMDLTTAKTNLPARSLYESLGWQRDEVFYAYNKRPKH